MEFLCLQGKIIFLVCRNLIITQYSIKKKNKTFQKNLIKVSCRPLYFPLNIMKIYLNHRNALYNTFLIQFIFIPNKKVQNCK